MTKTFKKLKYSGGFIGMNKKKVFKVILCAMLVLALVISNFAGLDLGFVKVYAQEPVTMQGSGSEGDPYQITNYTQLKEFAGIVNGGHTDACAKLINDIVCTDKLWVPIGNDYNNRYNGHFNDNDEETKKIIGLNNTGFENVDDREYQGLFGYIGSNGNVKNIGIEGGETKGAGSIGGVAGYNWGTITNCYNTGSISAGENYARVGGVAGYNGGTITNCYNTGSISGSGDNVYVGGVAGGNGGTITNCYNTGSINGGDGAFVGGVAGYNVNTITNYYYDSNRSNVSKAIGNQVDGSTINGLSTEEMTGSNADQNMEFTFGPDDVNPWLYQENDDNNYFYPHLNGVNFTAIDVNYDDAISVLDLDDLSSDEKIAIKDWPARKLKVESNSGTQDNPYEISDYNLLKAFSDIVNGKNEYAGNAKTDACAILVKDIVCTDRKWVPIGYYNSNTDNALYSGQFDGNNKKIIGLNNTGFNDVDNKKYQGLFGYIDSNGIVKNIGIEGGEIKGKDFIGGVAGYNFRGTITNCYNTGSISGSGVGAYVGGVAGYNNYGTITNCYNTGSISGGDNAYVGGVAGRNNGGTITNCYNTGSINGSGDSADIGGVAGYNNGTITNCYFDSYRSIVQTAIGYQGNAGTISNAIDLSTMQMTGSDALSEDCMLFEYDASKGEKSPWITKDDVINDETGSAYWYYPHLKGFDFKEVILDDESIKYVQLDSEEIVTDKWPGKVKVNINWSNDSTCEYDGTEHPLSIDSIILNRPELNTENVNYKKYSVSDSKYVLIDAYSNEPGNYCVEIKDDAGNIIDVLYYTINKTDYNVIYYVQDTKYGSWNKEQSVINAGTYKAVLEQTDNVEKVFTITPKSITVTANELSKTYGEQDPTQLTYTADALIGTDALTGSLVRAEGEKAGTYAITLGSLSAGENYTINFTGADFAIVPKNINSDAFVLSNSEYTYDGTEKTPTVKVLDGTKEIPDNEYTVEITDNIDAGTATVTVTDNANGNYNVSSGTKSFTINRAEAKVKAY